MPSSPLRRPLPDRTRPSTLLLFLVLMIPGTLLSGCNGDAARRPDSSGAPAGATASHVGAAVPAELRTSSEVGHVIGRLPGVRRKAVRKQVSAVVDRWWERAYLTPGLSRIDAAQVFPGFTRGAQRRARFDRTLMTNAGLDSEAVTPLMRKVRLDLLAVNGRARSVTARFDLRLRASGERAGRLRVSGRLFLVHKPVGWRVFGYDVSKGWL